MKIAFLAERRSEVSVLGGVLHELRRRGHELIAIRNGTMTPKAAEDRCSIPQLATEWPGVCVMRAAPSDALGLASAGTQFVTERTVVVDYCWDMLWQREGFLTFATERQKAMHAKGFLGPVVGSPMLAWELRTERGTDFIFFIPKIRSRWQIPVVWFLAYAARRFTRRAGLRLVGMTRQKHGRTGVPFMDAWASLDGPLWPPPTQRALATACVALHAQSGVGLECQAFGIPTYTAQWPLTPGLSSDVAALMEWKRQALLPGQSWTIVLRQLLHGEPPAIPWLDTYTANYLGPRDVHARVANYCEELCVS